MTFTGKRGDTYYHKGRAWLGPSNLIGMRAGKRSHFAERARAKACTKGPNHSPSATVEVATNDGPFVHVQIDTGHFGVRARMAGDL